MFCRRTERGRLRLFVRSLAGGAPRQITSERGEHWVRGWAPDGDRIVYERGEVTGNIWISDVPEPGAAAWRHWQARKAADRRAGRR